MTKTIRALGLFSGGLDSMLATAVLRAQGIDVTLICFVTPFFGAARARESAAHLGGSGFHYRWRVPPGALFQVEQVLNAHLQRLCQPQCQ